MLDDPESDGRSWVYRQHSCVPCVPESVATPHVGECVPPEHRNNQPIHVHAASSDCAIPTVGRQRYVADVSDALHVLASRTSRFDRDPSQPHADQRLALRQGLSPVSRAGETPHRRRTRDSVVRRTRDDDPDVRDGKRDTVRRHM